MCQGLGIVVWTFCDGGGLARGELEGSVAEKKIGRLGLIIIAGLIRALRGHLEFLC